MKPGDNKIECMIYTIITDPNVLGQPKIKPSRLAKWAIFPADLFSAKNLSRVVAGYQKAVESHPEDMEVDDDDEDFDADLEDPELIQEILRLFDRIQKAGEKKTPFQHVTILILFAELYRVWLRISAELTHAESEVVSFFKAEQRRAI